MDIFAELALYFLIASLPIALQLWKSGEDMYEKKLKELRGASKIG